MKELVKIKVENDQQFVLARDLYKALEVKTRFSKWADQNFKYFEKGTDYEGVLTRIPYNQACPDKFRELQDYAVTIDMAKELCMMNRTPKGKEIRQYFIEVEKDRNNHQTIVERPYKADHSSTKSGGRTMNETDNKIRVFGKDGERYVIVNELMKILKIEHMRQWISNRRKTGAKIAFYNGVYLIAESDVETLIKKSHAIVKGEKNTLLNQLNQAIASNVDEDIKEEEKYEDCLSEDLPFLSERGINFFMEHKEMTYADLKRRSGINDTLGRYFDGHKKFSLSNLKKIAKVLGTTVSMIVISVDKATDEMKANYQANLAYRKEHLMASPEKEQKKDNTAKPILNATKEAIVASLNKVDEIKVSMKQQFEAQQEQLKILQAQLEVIGHESAYLREALTDNSKTSEDPDIEQRN